MANIVATTLKTILKQKGLGVLSDPRLLKANLLDLCPQENTEINLLLIALQENIPQELKNHTNSVLGDVVILQMAKRLESNYCIEKSKAYWTVETWAYALGLQVAGKSDPNQPISQPAVSSPAFKPSVKFTRVQETLKLSEECSIEFIRIEPGKFMMGSPLKQRGRMPEELEAHEVVITRPFFMSIYPITFFQFETIEGYVPLLARLKPEGFKYFPVFPVTPSQAMKFCNNLSHAFDFSPCYMELQDQNRRLDKNIENLDKSGFRLPSEAEWEYACRAGTDSMFPWADQHDPALMSQYCWYNKSPVVGANTLRIGQKKPNPWGLHDMLGQMWELTDDIHQEDGHIIKGGCFGLSWGACKPSSRSWISMILKNGQVVYASAKQSGLKVGLCFRIVRYAD
jgi:formylglycine-generating enzyme required for sulfatase activity